MTDVKQEFMFHEYNKVFQNIPLKKLSKREKRLVRDCLDGKKDFTEDELEVLAGVVKRYGEIVEESEITELLENQQKVIDTINTEKELLDLLEKEQGHQELTVDLPFNTGKKRVTFEVLPINDSRALTTLESHASLFDDFTVEEKNFFNKAQNNPEKLTEDELDVYNHLLERLNNNALNNSEEMIIELLSHQLKIKGQALNVEMNRRIWDMMKFNVKMAVFIRVEDMLGLKDFDTSELFPVTE